VPALLADKDLADRNFAGRNLAAGDVTIEEIVLRVPIVPIVVMEIVGRSDPSGMRRPTAPALTLLADQSLVAGDVMSADLAIGEIVLRVPVLPIVAMEIVGHGVRSGSPRPVAPALIRRGTTVKDVALESTDRVSRGERVVTVGKDEPIRKKRPAAIDGDGHAPTNRPATSQATMERKSSRQSSSCSPHVS
jgi:hypothetical protein